MATTQSEIKELFSKLDTQFLKYEKDKVEPIIWQTKDFNVQIRHEVKVPAIAGSTIKYSFSTTNGDISFGLNFSTGNVVEVIREVAREPSDIEAIKGTYKADYDGVFTFIFDNSYSWFTDKLLTYNINLLQPSFTLADKNRVVQSRKLLHNMQEEFNQANIKLTSSQTKHESLLSDIANIEARLKSLNDELSNKKAVVKAARDEVDEMTQRIQYLEEKKAGLCIRCLDKKTLSNVLSYIGKEEGVYLACKYWKGCIDELK